MSKKSLLLSRNKRASLGEGWGYFPCTTLAFALKRANGDSGSPGFSPSSPGELLKARTMVSHGQKRRETEETSDFLLSENAL